MSLTRRWFLKGTAAITVVPMFAAKAEPIGDGKPLFSTSHPGWPKYMQMPIPEDAGELLSALNELFSPVNTINLAQGETLTLVPVVYGMSWSAEDDVEFGRYHCEKSATRALWNTAIAHYEQGKRRIFIRSNPQVSAQTKRDFLVLKMRVAFV